MIPHEDWLDQARRLAVGMRARVRHRRESRPNMVIGHDRDAWWCYCQRCKDGSRVPKEHVLLTAPAVPQQVEVTVPTDTVPVIGSEYEQAVGRFIASKGMMFPYLPTLHVSPQRMRLMLHDAASGWHGRDLTGKSDAKWIHYAKPHIMGDIGRCTIITEDVFSRYKVRFALRHVPEIGVCSTLGAGCSQTAALALKDCKHLVWMYDGDSAGDDGYKSGSKRMRVLVPRQYRARPPEGSDPKDMQCEDIRNLLKEVLPCNLSSMI